MRKYQRSPLWRFLYSPLMVTILFLLAILLARSAWGVYKKEELAAENVKASNYELSTLQDRKMTLDKDVAALEDKDGMEQALRAKFSVARPGEQVIVIGPEDSVDATSSAAIATPPKGGFWNFIKGFMKE